MKLHWKKDAERITSLKGEEIIILTPEYEEDNVLIGKRAIILGLCSGAEHLFIELLEDAPPIYEKGQRICQCWCEFQLVNDPDNNY